MIQRKGFTLIELVVAIGIIVTGVLSVFALFMQSAKVQRAQEGEAQALGLAQEGIEVVREIRDSNWLVGCPDPARVVMPYQWGSGTCFMWNSGLTDAGDGTGVALFNDTTNAWSLAFTPVNTITDAGAQFVVLQNNVITHSTPANLARVQQALPLWRLITLYPVCRDNTQGVETRMSPGTLCASGTTNIGIDVVSTVRWNVGNGFETRSVEERLYNWR